MVARLLKTGPPITKSTEKIHALAMIKFLAYRYSIVSPSKKSPDYDQTIVKEEVFKNIFNELSLVRKISFLDRANKHLLFFDRKYGDNTFILELAREEVFRKPTEGATSIEEVDDTRTPFVYLIIDLKRQIMMIQDKSTVFSDVDIVRNKLERFFDTKLEYISLSLLLKPITNKMDFWKEVATMDKINDLKIVLNAPNLFEGRFKASDLVKDFFEEFNFTEFQLRFKNAKGKLTVYKDNAKDFISLVSSGGGKYLLHAFRNGKRIVLDSTNFIVKKVYDEDDIKDVPVDRIESDLEDLDKYNE